MDAEGVLHIGFRVWGNIRPVVMLGCRSGLSRNLSDFRRLRVSRSCKLWVRRLGDDGLFVQVFQCQLRGLGFRAVGTLEFRGLGA